MLKMFACLGFFVIVVVQGAFLLLGHGSNDVDTAMVAKDLNEYSVFQASLALYRTDRNGDEPPADNLYGYMENYLPRPRPDGWTAGRRSARFP